MPDLDTLAFTWFCAAFIGFPLISQASGLKARSITSAVQRRRFAWMRNMASRENRMLDGLLMQALAQGNAFFASTSAIAIGGLAAMLGSGDKIKLVIDRLPLAATAGAAIVEVKILLMMAIFVFAFFKFAWAFRLSHYAVIMIGATPLSSTENAQACERHAASTAKLVGIAAQHANSGLRSFYFAFAALGWFFHPLVFLLATTWVLAILARREFFSQSGGILTEEAHAAGGPTPAPPGTP